VRGLLAHPRFYSLFRRLVGRDTARTVYAREHLRVEPGQRVLDIGCGPGDILAYLPAVHYEGYDISPEYIARARERFGERGAFHCRAVDDSLPVPAGGFDVVIAHGLLHHLDDDEARSLFRVARRALKPGGRMVTFDGCFGGGAAFPAPGPRQARAHAAGLRGAGARGVRRGGELRAPRPDPHPLHPPHHGVRYSATVPALNAARPRPGSQRGPASLATTYHCTLSAWSERMAPP